MKLSKKDLTYKIKTANGKVKIYPVFCEVTSKQIGWQTKVDSIEYQPAFLSLKVVSKNGVQLKRTDLNTTF